MNKCISHNQCIAFAIENAEKICIEKGINFTKSRKKVLEIIWESHGPIKAYDILKQLTQESELTSKPITVYRILDFLLENRMIHKIHSLNSYFGCSHPSDIHNCYFMICQKCLTTWECCDSTVLKNIKKKADIENFSIENAILEIFGTCEKCQ